VNVPSVASLRNNKFLMYLFIGGTASAIDVGLFLVLYELLGFGAIASHSVSIPTSAVFSFSCNAVFNFKKTDRILTRAFSFAVIVALGYLLGALIIWLTETYTPWGGSVGKILSLPFVFLFQFYLNSRISFGE